MLSTKEWFCAKNIHSDFGACCRQRLLLWGLKVPCVDQRPLLIAHLHSMHRWAVIRILNGAHLQ